MDSRLSRTIFLGAFGIALTTTLAGWTGAAEAASCPGNPNAIGTSRTIVVDPREHGRIGSMDYTETLPLADHEVVLTFDDGPLPPYSSRVLDILAAECVKATYFIVGSMAKAYPALVKRTFDEGHTVGTHSWSHPLRFRALSTLQAKAQIDDGIEATIAALGGDADKLAPFFRFPGFGWTSDAEDYLADRGIMVWGADAPADDWKRIGGKDVARRAIDRLERKGKGILLLHDIHQRTVDALPVILAELKARGFRIVHVVPSNAARPATPTVMSDWRLRSRPIVPPAPIALADVTNPDMDALLRRSVAELCFTSPPRETVGSRTPFPARQLHAATTTVPETTQSTAAKADDGHRHAAAHGKTDGHKSARARLTPAAGSAPTPVAHSMPSLHAIQ